MSSRSILIIEDDDDIREALAMVLDERGYRVASVSNGRDGLDWLRVHRDENTLVLLDLRMPVMDGHAFLRSKAEDPALVGLPVLVLSADQSDALAQLPTHVKGHVRKPFAIAQLLAAIAACG